MTHTDRAPITRTLIEKALTLADHHTLADVSRLTDITPYVLKLIIRYRHRPWPRHKLSTADRLAILAAPPNVTHVALARQYGVTPQYISRLRRTPPPPPVPVGTTQTFFNGTLRTNGKPP